MKVVYTEHSFPGQIWTGWMKMLKLGSRFWKDYLQDYREIDNVGIEWMQKCQWNVCSRIVGYNYYDITQACI